MMLTARVLLSLLCIFIAMVNGELSSPDKEAMTALSNSLKLPGNKNLFSDPDPCLWKGKIQCQGNRVTAIQIKNLNISGTLPADLISLTYLKVFEVMNNNITGKIPSLSGLKSLETFNVHNNGFTSIDKDVFVGLSSLQHVFLDNNPFDDDIFFNLADATSLVEFSAVNCNLQGRIEDLVDGLKSPSLTTLHLSNNFLTGELPASFSGSPVQSLMLNGQKGNEKLTGSISVLQYMTSLTEVSLQGNSFSGPIPNVSGLDSLKSFNVRENQLTGIVPSFAKLSSLSDVALGNNLLQGPTPSFNIKPDLDGVNSFCLDTPGTPCDPRVTTLLSIVEAFGYPVRFAESWKGNDPCSSRSPWVGITCAGGNSIIVINFKNMGLNGTISPRFSDLKSLQVINLSQNNLTGPVPKEFIDLNNLRTLDVSNNVQLCGNVPVLNSNTVVNTNGNPNIGKDCLSGSNGKEAAASSSSNAGKTAGYVIGIVLVLLVIIGFAVFFLVKKKKQYRKMHPRRQSGDDQDALKITIDNLYTCGSESTDDAHLMEARNIVISIQTLRDATDNFDKKNILGRGGFGIVYKGVLRDGTTIAVKRMESSVISGKGLDEFKSEIAVLTRVRHRNLVSLHGYCLEGNERLLVYQYMPQGTLSSHIFHWKEEGLSPLDWTRRLLIALDVARAVQYLHSLAHQSFIHRDLKPSNILLGDDMHAKVADFGLVRLAPVGLQSVETKIAGTFGYLAPEYAVTGRVTTKVDVYSFGVILMELLTGRKALDVRRSEQDVHLATWFRRMLIDRDSFSKAIDETIEVNEETLGSINKVAELANYCTVRESQHRPDMNYVVNVLGLLVERWKPTEGSRDTEDNYDSTPLPQLCLSQSFFGDNTLTSIPSQPPELDNTFESGHGR